LNDALKEWLVMKYREKNQKLINKIPKLTIDLKDRRKDFICGI
jgi:hypothetical protein